MLISIKIPFILTMLPLAISPGPANLLILSSSTAIGLRKTLPFIVGIYSVFAVQSFAVGIGFSEIIFRDPQILKFFQYAGSIFLIYLAYRFFQSSISDEKEETSNNQGLTIKDGVVLELLNFKAFIVQALMFSLFLDPEKSRWSQVVFMAAFTVMIASFSGLVWAVAGDVLGRFLKTRQGAVWQGRIFGASLLCVAIWMIQRG